MLALQSQQTEAYWHPPDNTLQINFFRQKTSYSKGDYSTSLINLSDDLPSLTSMFFGDFQSSDCSKSRGIPIDSRGISRKSPRRVRSRSGHLDCGTIVLRRNRMIVNMEYIREASTGNLDSCHSGSFLGILGLTASTLFQIRPWWAQILRI